MKALTELSPQERDELKRLSMQVRPVGSEYALRYEHLLAKARYFAEGDYDFDYEK